jgi:putative glycosyl hydrolase-like family 15 (GHL15) protein
MRFPSRCVAIAALFALRLLSARAAGAAGVEFFAIADSNFDQFTENPTPEAQLWMRVHYDRMLTYSPYFDRRVSWFPNAWVYKDLYAIYVGSADAANHPEWILHDLAGNALYIPYGCSGGMCPQYAADVGNPDFRTRWIADAGATLAAGYRGLFVDDVNLTLARVSDGAGQPVTPHDPRTGQAMTEWAWRGYMADFTAQIRSAFPTVEIAHNALWFIGDTDPSVQREIAAADWAVLERGVNDAGIRGGDGTFGLDTFLAHVDFIHGMGRSVAYVAGARSRGQREYGLAALLLLDAGRDMLGNQRGGTPNDWWSGYDVSLGLPTGDRYRWAGLLRRDFAGGLVLLNPPDGSSQRLALAAPCMDLSGRTRRTVRLRAASGAVLRCP